MEGGTVTRSQRQEGVLVKTVPVESKASKSFKDIKMKLLFYSSPELMYQCLVDDQRISFYTQSPAQYERKIGGKFSFFGGQVTGTVKNLVISFLFLYNQFQASYWNTIGWKLWDCGRVEIPKLARKTSLRGYNWDQKSWWWHWNFLGANWCPNFGLWKNVNWVERTFLVCTTTVWNMWEQFIYLLIMSK